MRSVLLTDKEMINRGDKATAQSTVLLVTLSPLIYYNLPKDRVMLILHRAVSPKYSAWHRVLSVNSLWMDGRVDGWVDDGWRAGKMDN